MPRQNNNAEKKLQTNIKSAQGTFAMAQVMAVIYVVKALISKNFNFWFCNYITELVFKSAKFTEGFEGSFSEAFESTLRGSLPTIAAIAIMLAYTALLLGIAFAAQKKPKLIYAELVLYGIDSLCLAAGRIFAFPSAAVGDGWIDVIFHAFVLAYIVVGVVSLKKLSKGQKA